MGFVQDILGFDPTPGFSLGFDTPVTKALQNAQPKADQNRLIQESIKAQPKAVLGNTAPASSGAYSGSSGGYSSGGGGGSSTSAADIAALNQQEDALRALFGDIDTTQNQGLTQLDDKYNGLNSSANDAESRAERDFATKLTDNNQGKQSAYDQVDTNARTLNDSVRRLLGLASGGDSSAYQIAAPNAVARDASGKRQAVNTTFGTNARNITTALDDTKTDYQRQLAQLAAAKKNDTSSLLQDIGSQRNNVNQQIGSLEGQKAAAAGGGLGAQMKAASPYTAAIAASKASLAGLFDKYRTPVNVDPLKVAVPTLGDYTVDKSAINAGNQAPGQDYSPYEYFLNKKPDDQPLS